MTHIYVVYIDVSEDEVFQRGDWREMLSWSTAEYVTVQSFDAFCTPNVTKRFKRSIPQNF